MSLSRFLDITKKTSTELSALRRIANKPKNLTREQRNKIGRFPALFRQACQNLALARHRDYTTRVVGQLNRVALDSHHQMYGSPGRPWRGFVEFLTVDFPAAVRREKWIAFWCFAMFFAPIFIIAVIVQDQPELAYSILGPEMISDMESMYANETGTIRVERPADSDVLMFGFYIRNNIGIAFWTFAGGVFLGLGSMFFLLYNGVVFGAVGGHLHRVGAGENLYSFVIAHGSLELTGIAIAGMAGLVMGRSIVSPGQYTRAQAFKLAGRDALTLILGAAGMLLLAAFVEAFWSPRVLPYGVKYTVGGVLWLLVLLYFVFAGRTLPLRRSDGS